MTQTQFQRSRRRADERQSGFTIIELLIALTIVGLFAMIAGPSFMSVIQSNRLTTQANDFVGALYFARSEAIKLNRSVTVCSSSTGTSCDAAEWNTGWIVWHDADDGGDVDNNPAELLRVASALDASNTIRDFDNAGANPAGNSISFSSRGLSSVEQTWVFCDIRGADEARAVVLSLAGRAKVAQTTATGGALTCP